MDRSATGVTVVVALAELLAGLGSSMEELTAAWLVIWPPCCGRTFTSALASPPFAIVPRLQVTVPLDSVQALPCDGVAESYVTPAGSVSVSTTPDALCGPALWTPSV